MEKVDVNIFFHLAIIQMHEVHYLADYNDKNIVNSFYYKIKRYFIKKLFLTRVFNKNIDKFVYYFVLVKRIE